MQAPDNARRVGMRRRLVVRVVVPALAVLASACLIARPALAQDVLIYGPSTHSSGGSGPVLTSNLGFVVTLVDAAGWCSMTTADFEAYDALFFDGALPADFDQPADCVDALAGTPGSSTWAEVIIDSEATWGPAVVAGPIYVATGDPAFHIGAAGTQRVVENAAWWATSEGSTTSGGATGLVLFTGGLEAAGAFLPDALQATLGSFSSISVETEAVALPNSSHASMTTPNALTVSDFVWGNFCHGTFMFIPADATPLVACASGDYGAVALPEPSGDAAAVAGSMGVAWLGRRRARRPRSD